jgi:hypothetical protein
MSKNLKRIIAMAMVIGTISVAAPAISNANFLTTKAYASSDDENDDDTFDSLKLETSDGSSIKLYDDDSYDSDEKVDSDDVDPDTDYYAKTSSNSINVDIDGVSSKYVRVFKDDDEDDISDSVKGKSVGSDISLSSDYYTIAVKIYDEEPDDDVEYGDDDDVSNEYTIHVKYTGDDSSDSSDDDSDEYDDIYLDSLSVEGNSISLSDSKTTYTYDVASDVDEVTIKAKPEDEDEDTVEIDGDEVDDSDNYKKDVDLNKGENDITVRIEDEDDNEREYTLKITRADNTAATSTATSTAASQTSTATVVTTGKVGWVQVNGGWQYNDSTGAPLKSYWLFDRNYGKWYYLGTDGMMAHDTYIGKWRVGSDGAWIS